MWEIIYLFCVIAVSGAAAQCSFPGTFIGTWVSSADGTWVVNSSHLMDLELVTGISGHSSFSFTCYEVQGTMYALRSTVSVELFTGVFNHLYTCLDIRLLTAVKHIYYKNTDTGLDSEVTVKSTFNDICNKADYNQSYHHRVALLSGSETAALTTCPETLFGSFHYDTCTDPSSTDTSVNVCDSRQTLIYDYTLCDTTQMFSAEGVLDCLHFEQSGTVTYLTVYNRDSATPDNADYYRFSCLAIEEQPDGTRQITANPQKCVVNQSPATIAAPGKAMQFTPYYLCPITTTTVTTTTKAIVNVTESSGNSSTNDSNNTNIGLIIGIIAAIIAVLIIAAIIIICCCLRKRRQRKKVDDEERAIAEDTDDQKSHRSEGRRGSDRRGSRSSSQDEDKRSIDSGIGREPPSGRATGSDYKRLDDQEHEEEAVKTVGEVDVDDKSGRPRSEQVNGKEISNNEETIEAVGNTIQTDTKTKEDTEDERFTDKRHLGEINEELSDKDIKTDLKGTYHDDKDTNNRNATSLEEQEVPNESQSIQDIPNTSSTHENEKIITYTTENKPNTEEGHEEINENDKDTSSMRLAQSNCEQGTDIVDSNKIPSFSAHVLIVKSESNESGDGQDYHKDGSLTEGHTSDKSANSDKMEKENIKESSGISGKDIVNGHSYSFIGNDEENRDKKQDDLVDSKTNNNTTEEDERKTDQTSRGRHESEGMDTECTKKKHRERRVIGLTSDGEEIFATESENADDDDSSIDDIERERRRIGRKKAAGFTPAGPLTTVLVTRQDEERKRNKLRSKSKRQKMRKLAKKKTKRNEAETDMKTGKSNECYSSGEEGHRQGNQEAPYIEQYRYKKRIESKLDDEHYWSEPAYENEEFRRFEDLDSTISSSSNSLGESTTEGSDSEDEYIVGPDGIHVSGKKTSKHFVDSSWDKNLKISNTNDKNNPNDEIKSKIKRQEETRIPQDVENGNDVRIDAQAGKMKQTNHTLNDEDKLSLKRKEIVYNVPVESQNKHSQKHRDDKLQNGTRLIQVQEHEVKGDHLGYAEVKMGTKTENNKSKRTKQFADTNDNNDFETNLESNSDTDSGVEDEEILDVVLTGEQQQMIVNALFDDDMKLRPEFDRDEDGRIVRKLDNTVIYDPHTGRFTFRRRIGRLFNMPRLKRNNKGRPTGGYVEDEFGPKMIERQNSSLSRGSHREIDSRMSLSDSPLYDKRSRGESRNVGFRVPDDDFDSVSVRDLEVQKRGRRDIGSGIRRKLKNRLFRKRRKRNDPSSAKTLFGGQPRRAWTSDTQHTQHTESDGELNPILYLGGRAGYLTPRSQRRTGTDPQQWQKYREGLESDRKILAGLQDKLSADGNASQTQEAAFNPDVDGGNSIDPNLRFSENEEIHDGNGQHFGREPSYWSPDGRFVVREKGCPELQPPPLFTILRRPATMTRGEMTPPNEFSRRRDAPKSAPVHMQNNIDHSDGGHETHEGSNDSLADRSNADTQTSYIDDNRLRRLLEELYRDKKYFDQYVETTEPKSEIVIHTKGLAEHGRGYLLERADYWDKRGPLPPRPPLTEIGWKMQRQQTLMDSARTSEHGSTVTPDMRPYTVPGYIDVKTPRDDSERNNENNETFV